jgi:hypothetical protein
MSWPVSPGECPRCRYFDPLVPSVRDDAGYEIVGLCLHPRIATDLFRARSIELSAAEPCPCFFAARRERPKRSGFRAGVG